MIALLQRVSEARVTVAGEVIGEIEAGLLVFFCVEPNDTEALAQRMLSKILKLRIFGDDEGKMNRSVHDVQGGLLLVSQFTLAADTQGGNRPGFTGAASPALGEALFNHFVGLARAQHPTVQTGRFAADMRVHLVNDGPITIPLHMN
ncbi:D-aminoacyl-tRNA deacylase [Hydrogenophaga sp. PAMC20947]|uniref:D-aminoacyl-tRNA deacylase n=1 Tax=Hydrogenophaga sp. PAMC20947 TaxID=2565558 RepID=UPI00109DD5AD|nr:D-aminoacyl-tRNA deacylase [Hydrogenophaga sp. PAMC20947]QCB47004.1 D-tyrosyl-tRNA(Tyr) deacylase [Hydrogenophaga sp. PAMC20947]